ncbi:carbon-nitrogen hydrolase family protein [Amycolatopsis cynarae]|uniref:Carbon-nitrogen hydrolase family protein n=1 Tax=Amycolatopsis cynarae TaxID=2995223 RepID=A0ABY7BCY8_9PSEU|nr:carbon-nitrogen hydrolase family protein [Amycolatopsis sp. HUAS 11-8]WAL68498.1 carbon-nitrogen hydrolase family protein [Amycolatopsis sp. HUAS 11-8]
MRVALCQFSAGDDPDANLAAIVEQAGKAAADGARLVVFPEAAMARFGGDLAAVAQPLDGPWASAIIDAARALGVVIVAGMFVPAPGGRVANTLLVAGAGKPLHYDKIHLFDAFGYAESDTVAPGRAPLLAEVDGVTLGFATCYDVRFPELFVDLALRGAQVIVLPTSWGAGPGKLAQWETLVRARALDATTWLLAVDQAAPELPGAAGAPLGIGHSMIVGPDGAEHGRLDERPGMLVADLDPGAVAEVRGTIPVLANRAYRLLPPP